MIARKPLSYAHITLVEGEQGGGKSCFAVARVRDAYKKDHTIRIFCNFHLYGMPYVYCTLAQIIEWLDAGIIQDAYVIIDEAYIGANARDGMASFGKALNKYGMSIRKRHLYVYLIYPHERMADWVFRWAITERVMCSYDETTRMITVTIKKKKQKPRTISFYAPQYWKYYNTDELFQLSTGEVGRAIAGVR